MSTRKKILFIILSVFLIWLSYEDYDYKKPPISEYKTPVYNPVEPMINTEEEDNEEFNYDAKG